MRAMLPVLWVLTGCGIDSMAGDWSGEIECYDGSEASLDIEVDDSEGELEYIGDFFLRAASLYEDGEDVYRLESDWAGTMTLTQTLPSDEQEVTFTLSERAPDCRVFKEGNLLAQDCYEDGLPLGFTFDGNFTGDWDGLDDMEIGSNSCEGDLSR
ncbi:MAG: hypothetical protein ACI8S6_001064 [Myxococcota bacterium]|jgi:hypothetical protein